jgi:hypothetical protein
VTEKTVRIVYVTNLDGGNDLRAALNRQPQRPPHHRKPAALDAERPWREVLDENRARIAEIIERERERP